MAERRKVLDDYEQKGVDLPVVTLETVLDRDPTMPSSNHAAATRRSPLAFFGGGGGQLQRQKEASSQIMPPPRNQSQPRPYDEQSNVGGGNTISIDGGDGYNTTDGYTDNEEGFTSGYYETETETDASLSDHAPRRRSAVQDTSFASSEDEINTSFRPIQHHDGTASSPNRQGDDSSSPSSGPTCDFDCCNIFAKKNAVDAVDDEETKYIVSNKVLHPEEFQDGGGGNNDHDRFDDEMVLQNKNTDVILPYGIQKEHRSVLKSMPFMSRVRNIFPRRNKTTAANDEMAGVGGTFPMGGTETLDGTTAFDPYHDDVEEEEEANNAKDLSFTLKRDPHQFRWTVFMCFIVHIILITLIIGFAVYARRDQGSTDAALSSPGSGGNTGDATSSPNLDLPDVGTNTSDDSSGADIEDGTEATPEPSVWDNATAGPSVEATMEDTMEATAEDTAEDTVEETAGGTAEGTAEDTAEETAENTAEPTCVDTLEVSAGCFATNSGEDILVFFRSCNPQAGDWVGVYEASEEPTDLLGIATVDWLFTCGDQECQDPVLQEVVPFQQENGEYVPGVSYQVHLLRDGDGPVFSAYASSPVFRVVEDALECTM